MQIVRTLSELAAARASSGEDWGFVPTMGYLHDGHFSLVRESKARHARTAVSIFVNPTQFGPNEDLSRYPRDFERDRAGLEALGVDLLFAPEPSEMYPEGSVTKVSIPGLSSELCGAFRPGHFDGVLTIVLKLFQLVRPKAAYFGKKDYQQWVLIRSMARDLNLGVEVRGLETIREKSGLAMSSRNTYLSAEEKALAIAISSTLRELVEHAKREPGVDAASLCARGTSSLEKSGFRVDYVACREAETLSATEKAGPGCVFLAAAWMGKTRLIDNLEVR